jgi:hypothetical protein
MGGCQGCSTRANDETNYLSVGKNGKIITQKGSGKLVAFVRQASVFGGTLVKQMEIPSSPPVDPTSESFTTKTFGFRASSCLMRNTNPFPDKLQKPLQDACVYLYDQTRVLCALFDGHGENGHLIAQMCVKITRKYFGKKTEVGDEPQKYLSNLFHYFDRIIRTSQVDARVSGTTAVVCFVYRHKVYWASVGDSRAIAATKWFPQSRPVPESLIVRKDEIALCMVSEKRKSTPAITLFPVQLTKDQKPEDPEERRRIESAGGFVD